VNVSSLFAETTASTKGCSKVAEFKKEYVNLLNELKTKGNKVEIDDKGNIKASTAAPTDSELEKGRMVQEELYKHYKNALVKVAKIYQQTKGDQSGSSGTLEKTSKSIAGFFKKIDPDQPLTSLDNKDFETLLADLHKVEVKDEKYKLKNDDIYFLKKLMTHSQDVICSLQGLKRYGNQKTDFLQDTANNVVSSLRKISNDNSIQLFDVKEAINQSVKDSLDKMKNILSDKNCRDVLTANLNGRNVKNMLGSDLNIQTCNYNKFLDSLRFSDYYQFDTILHFMNANKLNSAASTELNWIQEAFNKDKPENPLDPITCSKSPEGSLIVRNMPRKEGSSETIDESKINCKISGAAKTGSECLNLVNISFKNGTGFEFAPKDNKSLNEFSVKGGTDCVLTMDNPPKNDPPAKKETPAPEMKNCTEQECKMTDAFKDHYSAFNWNKETNECYGIPKGKEGDIPVTVCKGKPETPKKDGPGQNQNPSPNQTEKEKCEKRNDETTKASEDAPRIRFSWDDKEKKCIDKDDKKGKGENSSDEVDPKSSDSTPSLPQTPPARFVPVNIPQRQPYILPGMP
jgi:hypothetical protein